MDSKVLEEVNEFLKAEKDCRDFAKQAPTLSGKDALYKTCTNNIPNQDVNSKNAEKVRLY